MMEQEAQIFGMALGLKKPWEIAKIEFEPKKRRLDIWIEHTNEKSLCPKCGKEGKIRDRMIKSWRHLDFFQHQCYLHCKVPRVKCEEDGIHLTTVPWSHPRSGFTALFEAFAMLLVKEMPVNAAARILRIQDTRLWRIVRRYVDKARENTSYEGVRAIGIDETSVKPRHSYISLFADIEQGRLLYATTGNTNRAVKEFAEDLSKHGGDVNNIDKACCDLWRGFEKGLRENIPNAKITYDRFHFVKKINDAMDQVRRSESASNKELKGMRFLFLKNPDHLTEEEKAKLKPLREDNTKTARAFSLRQSLLGVYDCSDKHTAVEYLNMWLEWAKRSRLKPFVTLSKSIRRNIDVIANWFDSRISNGLLEGINSLIQAAKAKARGYRNPYNFIAVAYLVAGKLNLPLHT